MKVAGPDTCVAPSYERMVPKKPAMSFSATCRCRVQGSRFRVQGPGCRDQSSGCRVQGAGFRVQGSGCWVQGSGFGVQTWRTPRKVG